MPLPIEALEAELLRLPTVEPARLLDRVVLMQTERETRPGIGLQPSGTQRSKVARRLPVSGPEAVERMRSELL